MSPLKLVGVALIILGLLTLVYGGFAYTKTSHETKIGSLELSVKDREAVNIPVCAGVVAIVVGGCVILLPRKS